MVVLINFFFDTCRLVWTLILDHWILSIFMLIALLSYIVSFISTSKGDE